MLTANSDAGPSVLLTDAQPILPSPEATRAIEIGHDLLLDNGVFGFDVDDIRSRPFNLLRSQVRKYLRRSQAKLIGVISATPGVGKTFVACNLAAAMSRIPGVDAYLVDLDLRRPSVADRFGLERMPGVQDYLLEELDDLAAAAFRPSDQRLVVLPSSGGPAPSAELLDNPRADLLFAGLRALPEQAVVIVDMPPVFANDDAAIIASRVDALLFVVEDGVTTGKQIKDGIRLLAPTPVLGTVLNRYRRGLVADEYGYGFAYGYEYKAEG